MGWGEVSGGGRGANHELGGRRWEGGRARSVGRVGEEGEEADRVGGGIGYAGISWQTVKNWGGNSKARYSEVKVDTRGLFEEWQRIWGATRSQ